MASCHSQVSLTLRTLLTLQNLHIPASFNMYLVINKCVTPVKVSNFSDHYLRNRSTMDIGIFGLYRHTLTWGTPSRSLAHSSWDILYIGYTPASYNWISPSRSTWMWTVPGHIFCTSAASRFHHLPNNVSMSFCGETKLQYPNSQWAQKTECTLSQLWWKCLFATLEGAIVSCRCNGGFHIYLGNKEFSP
jgi:hypothetical protein